MEVKSRKRRPSIYRLIEQQRNDLREAGKNLIWKSDGPDSPSHYYIVVIFPLKGFVISEQVSVLLQDHLPQLIMQKKSFQSGRKVAFLVTADEGCMIQTAIGMRMIESEDQVLSSQQRQTVIKYYLESIRYSCRTMKDCIPAVRFREGEVIITKLLRLKLIDSMFPLHSRPDLKRLKGSWVTSFFSKQPLDSIQSYFGFKIAMYFVFLGHYTEWLIFPSVIGLLIAVAGYFVSDLVYDSLTVVFMITVSIWSFFYVESLKSKCKEKSDEWSVQNEDPNLTGFSIRSEFRGNVSYDSDRNVVHIEYASWKRKVFQYLVTIPVTLTSLAILFYVMLQLLHFNAFWDKEMIGVRGYAGWTSWIPNILFALVVTLMDKVYYEIAVGLNDRENHAYELVHENQLVLKLILFQFVNSFMSLFYLAFYVGDMKKLKEQLIALLITRQVTGNLGEVVYPVIHQVILIKQKLKKFKDRDDEDDHPDISAAETESLLNSYDSTYNDYLEMFIQFGYVILFSSMFPIAAFCALLNNVIEIRSDAFKLCVTCRRPFAGERVKDIGNWLQALNVLVYLSILVNSALLVKSGLIQRLSLGSLDQTNALLVGVLMEHLLLALKLLIEKKKELPFLYVISPGTDGE